MKHEVTTYDQKCSFIDLVFNKFYLYQHFVSVHSAAQTSLAAVQEVDAIVLSVETNHVTTQHALQYLVRPGEYPHDVPGGEGYVEEETHPDTYIFLHTDVSDGVGGEH